LAADTDYDWTAANTQGTAFTFTDTDSVIKQESSMSGVTAPGWSQLACWGNRVIDLESTTIDAMVSGDMSFDAGAMIFPDSADTAAAVTYTSTELTDLKVFSVTQGAASLVAAATAVAVSLALF